MPPWVLLLARSGRWIWWLQGHPGVYVYCIPVQRPMGSSWARHVLGLFRGQGGEVLVPQAVLDPGLASAPGLGPGAAGHGRAAGV